MNVRPRSRGFGARGLMLASLTAAVSAGCFADPTEVVIVVDTDATPFRDFGQVNLQVGRAFSPAEASAFASPAPGPITLGVTPTQGSTSFEVVVMLTGVRTRDAFLQRKVSNVPFVSEQIRALFIPMLSVCSCNGTNCPHALDAECRDITAPVLTPFDANNIPRLTR
jgi:hypothetical protein